jgi:nicotinate-nucleotide adenylyltransferase
VARTAARRLGLDRVLWLVSPQNPLKSTDETADLAQRLTAVRGAARGPRMIVSDLEAPLGSRYTVDTLRWLKGRYPGVRFVWIMGADSLAGFHRWRGWAQIARDTPLAVVSRPGAALRGRLSPMARRFASGRVDPAAARSLPGRPAPAWTYLAAPYHHVSSTLLRGQG